MIDFNDPKTLNSKLKDMLNRLNEIELLIIKCHLLVEFALNEFLTLTTGKSDVADDRLPFSQKVKKCKVLGLFDSAEDDLRMFILTLTKLRNQIAHTLSCDQSLLEELCLYTNEEKVKKGTFLKRQLKVLSLFNAGRIIGIAKVKKTTLSL